MLTGLLEFTYDVFTFSHVNSRMVTFSQIVTESVADWNIAIN